MALVKHTTQIQRVLQGMVCTTIGSWSWIPVTLEKSGTDAAVDLKKEAKDLDP